MATTSGLVQKLKWVQNLQSAFVYIGAAPNAVQLKLVQFDGTDPESFSSSRAIIAALTRALVHRLPVSVFHGTGSTVITGVDLRPAAIQIDAVEVTQAIQTLAHAVPLLAAKPTVVRVYLSSQMAAPVTVRGTLQVVHSSGSVELVASAADVVVDPAEFLATAAKRDDAAKTLNFLLPSGSTAAGTIDVSLAGLEDAGTGATYDVVPLGVLQSRTFEATPPLRITVVGFTYSMPTLFAPTAQDFDLMRSWLTRAYPTGEVIWSQRSVAANAAPPFGCSDINTQLAAIRALDVAAGTDARTHYYGLVSDGGFFMRGCAAVPGVANPAAVGCGPTGPGDWGWDFDGSYGDWYGGHELGHTYGRKHPGFCGETADDLANYPFDNGQLSNADGLYGGFDVGDSVNGLGMAALPGVVWHDVMTYCARQWLSSYTYTGIRQRLVDEDALPAGAVMGAGRPDERFSGGGEKAVRKSPPARRRLVQVVGRADFERGAGSIDYVLPLDDAAPSAPEPESGIGLQTRDATGKVLERVAIGAIPVADEGHGSRRVLISAVIAVHPDAAGLDLLVAGEIVDRFAAGGEPAVVSEAEARSTDSGAELCWRTASGPAAAATYTVQISRNGGRTWETIGVGLRAPRVPLDEAMVKERRPVRVRVRASSGFAATETEFDYPAGLAPGSASGAKEARHTTEYVPRSGFLERLIRALLRMFTGRRGPPAGR